MSLNDRLAKDMALMTSPRHFGESIVYYPGGDLTAGVEISVLIDREEVGPLPEAPRGTKWSATIHVSRDPRCGIPEHTKQDVADVPLRYGAPRTRVSAHKLLTSDAGSFSILVVR